MPEATLHFPRDFRWGTATAAHQVEGNNTNNDYYVWEQTPGHIFNNEHSGLACNWWAPGGAEADFDLMAQMGQNTHRLSVEWSRIEPREGTWDESALERYREMVRGLRQRGIEPMVTLFHFTQPIWFTERGGFENEAAVQLFERFAIKVVEALGEFCDLWCTINEPMVRVTLGYIQGKHAPGLHAMGRALTVASTLLRAHAAAYYAIHRVQPQARVGYACHLRQFDPARPWFPPDQLVAGVQNWLFNEVWMLAVHDGWIRPPLGGVRMRIPHLARTYDYFGLNYYTRDLVAFDLRAGETAFGRNFHAADAEISDAGFGELYPEGLFRALKRVAHFHRPIYITENGLPDADDDQRPGYLLATLAQMWRAINFNWPILGYYHWTLVDNFEWVEGWSLRFGLLALDVETQQRTLRKSGALYSEICRTNTLSSDMATRYAPHLRAKLFPG